MKLLVSAVLALAFGAQYSPVQAQSYTGKVDITDVCGNASNLQAKINQITAANGAIYIPAGTTCALNTNTLTLTKMTPIIGDGSGVSKIQYCGSAAAIKITLTAGFENGIGHIIRGVRIEPCTAGTGTNGLHVALQSNAPQVYVYAYFDISDVSIGNFGSYGLRFENVAGNADGFFAGRVRNSSIQNGILGQLTGDSLVFENVNVSGNNQVQLSSYGGAILTSFRGGTINTSNGFFNLTGQGFRVENVTMQSPNNVWGANEAIRVTGDDFYINNSSINISNLPADTTKAAIRLLNGAGSMPKVTNTQFTAPTNLCAVKYSGGDAQTSGNTYGPGPVQALCP